jgi:hypothetical protein
MGKLFEALPDRWASKDKTPLPAVSESEAEIDKRLEQQQIEVQKLLGGESMTSERVERAAAALKDAAEAYKIAGVPAQSEDIRALAITFMIDEGKNGRVANIREGRATEPTPVAPVQDNSSVRRDFFKPEVNREYEVTVEKYAGTVSTDYGTSDKFELLVNGEPKLQTTKGKLADAYRNNTGKSGRLLQTKNGKFTNYSFKVGGVEQVA